MMFDCTLIVCFDFSVLCGFVVLVDLRCIIFNVCLLLCERNRFIVSVGMEYEIECMSKELYHALVVENTKRVELKS